jgi:lipid A 3-O-deacylase
MKRITFCLTLLVIIFANPVAAEDSVEVTLGKASDDIDIVRLAWRKSWSSRWLHSSIGELTGFHAVSFNRWQGRDGALNVIAYSPVFVYRLRAAPLSYVKLGIGLAYLSDTVIQMRDMSSHFQFEDQIGMGWAWSEHDVSLVYMHYSNAGLRHPNDGIDVLVLSFARRI